MAKNRNNRKAKAKKVEGVMSDKKFMRLTKKIDNYWWVANPMMSPSMCKKVRHEIGF